MLSKKSLLGIAIGSIGIILGTFFLIQDLMSNVHDVNDIVDMGKSDIFSFDALQHYHEISQCYRKFISCNTENTS